MVAAYRSGVGDETVPTRLVEHSEIEENGWDLNIGRYLKSRSRETVDVKMALVALEEARARLRVAEAQLDERLRAAGYA